MRNNILPFPSFPSSRRKSSFRNVLIRNPFLLFLLVWVPTFVGTTSVYANNLLVSTGSLTNKDTTNHNYDLQFNIKWDNSWRIAGAPSATANWDAAWVFAKFSKKLSATAWSDWNHCTLLSTGAVAPSGCQIDLATTTAVYVGAFLRRDATGTGSVNYPQAKLRWAYSQDGLADTDTVKLKVFGIEMVYVSSGPFWVGDTDNTQTNNFYAGNSGTPRGPIQLSTENAAITVADTTGNLYYDADTGDAGDRGSPIPAAFPKGVAAFYLMKYEISQRQYCEFLNTLNASQQTNRSDVGLNFNSSRNFIKKTGGAPAFFGCDANNNAGAATSANKTKLNESADGGGVACNYISYMDVAAYADWAGLRPFTELEFEKAARGPAAAVNDEYAWGTAVLEAATSSLNNSATKSEAANQGNMNYDASSPDGPYRVGNFADAGSSRQNAGAGYYGALDLSGNLLERPATVGNATGRGFTGTHGDGRLSSGGFGNNADWPGYSGGEITGATGSGLRGGSWGYSSPYARVSDRLSGALTGTARGYNYGGRAARTSP